MSNAAIPFNLTTPESTDDSDLYDQSPDASPDTGELPPDTDELPEELREDDEPANHEPANEPATTAGVSVSSEPAPEGGFSPVTIGDFTIRRAVRSRAWLRILASGTSGSGKTMSALKLAYGLVGTWDRIALIDSENGSGELYSNCGEIGEYLYCRLDPPYSPQRYMAAIDAVSRALSDSGGDGGVIIIDSASHEWDGEGGCLEMIDALARNARNKWTDTWGKVTPLHTRFVQSILKSQHHVIVTSRRKSEHVQEEVDGKKKVRKIGLKEIQREGFEYEFTLGFELSQEHYASASKDRTDLFADSVPFVISAETGRKVRDWWASGATPKPILDRDEVLKDLFHEFKRALGNEKEKIAKSLESLSGGYVSFQLMPTEEAYALLQRIRTGRSKIS